MTLIVGMEAVVLCTLKELGIFIHQRIEATEGIHIYYGHSPEITCLFHTLNVSIDIFATLIGKIFARLPVLIVGIKLCTMDRRQEDDLLGRIETLDGDGLPSASARGYQPSPSQDAP